MYPIAFQLGSLTIRWYGVMAACGFIAAALMIEYNRRFAKLSKDQSSTLLFIALICGILGARLFYCIQFFNQFRGELWKVVRIDQGGLVFYGGFLLALAAVLVYSHRQKLDMVRVLDVFAPAMAVAHGFGRIGCFLNGCCFGRPTTLWWGVTPPQGSTLEMLAGSMPIHPVQLVEAGENFLLALLYCYLLRHAKRGVTMAAFMLIYGVLRFVNETMRGDNVLYFHLTPAQWIGILLSAAGAGLLGYFLHHEQKN